MSALNAISPIDGRYQSKTSELNDFFSEFALIRYRVRVEVEYFIALSDLGLSSLNPLNQNQKDKLRQIYHNFKMSDAESIKTIENTTNHDVKAVEYFLKDKFEHLGLANSKEFIHFGLTSQDINNTSIPLSLKEATDSVYLKFLDEIITKLLELSETWEDVPMLAKTHGQPASPTRLGKEIKVFAVRLLEQKKHLLQVPFSAKFGGATGNFNAHHLAFPKEDWKAFGKNFTENYLGLSYSFPTTQIEHYDNLAALFDVMKRINTIIIDLDRDVWSYISMGYFKQKIKKGEVGSSAMPHKVNPIDFENSEGNLGIANAVFEHLSAKLPISRLQRDLTDSTVLRNIGMPFAHTLVAIKSTLKGLDKLLLNEKAIHQDLEDNWAVVAEAIQTILRRENYPNPYETLKALTRTNTEINAKSIAEFIETLEVSDKIKAELKQITPFNYTGI
ncbi:MAG: adenylosuccinate lyase [Bacteroidetes bacterium]|jgi:adenylosuccinate lyase|nr:adenylosuccinate lyase [Bacteroidota bacterium]